MYGSFYCKYRPSLLFVLNCLMTVFFFLSSFFSSFPTFHSPLLSSHAAFPPPVRLFVRSFVQSFVRSFHPSIHPSILHFNRFFLLRTLSFFCSFFLSFIHYFFRLFLHTSLLLFFSSLFRLLDLQIFWSDTQIKIKNVLCFFSFLGKMSGI